MRIEPFFSFLIASAIFSFFIPFVCGIFPKIFQGFTKPKTTAYAAYKDYKDYKAFFVDVRFLIGMVMGVCFLTLGFECIPILLDYENKSHALHRLFVIMTMAIVTLIALMVSLKKNNFGWISREEK